MKQKFDVTGMSCSACSARVEKVVTALPGVDTVAVSLLTNSMTVDYDDNTISTDGICQAVDSAGYHAVLHGVTQSIPQAQPNDELHQMVFRLKTSIVFLLPLFYLSMGRMLHWPMPDVLQGPEHLGILSLVLLLLTIPILFINRKFFIVGYSSLLQKAPNMDTLIAVGSTASFGYGLISMFQIEYALGIGNMALLESASRGLYFESAGMILTLITIGKTLETKSKGKTSAAIEALMDMTPKTAVLLRNGEETTVPVEQIQVGDTLRIRPGEAVPVDGVVVSGTSTVDESALTGESLPVEKHAGTSLLSGSVNQRGALCMEARRVGGDTTLSQIIELVETAAASKAPIARLADKIAGVFVPTVMTISLLTFLLWLFVSGDVPKALTFGISVMVISCPCALGLATPVAIMVGTGKGAEQGILFRSAEAIETLHKGTVAVLDKTGTVTRGKPEVCDVIPLNNLHPDGLLSLAASIEVSSEHPLSTAIVDHAKEKQLRIQPVSRFTSHTGRGISAVVDGTPYYGGNQAYMEELGIDVSPQTEQANQLASAGKTPLYFADETGLIGIIAVTDAVKADSKDAVSRLKALGLSVCLLTGDNPRTANAVAKEIGADEVIAGVLPDRKEAVIREWQSKGHTVIMVGDGINDAPALVRANVGVAIGAGSDIAIESADVVLMRNSLADVVSAMELSKATIRNIKQNLFWALFYNLIGIPIAAGALYPLLHLQLKPWIAAAAMSMSSVTVVSNALRLRTFRPSNAPVQDTSNTIEKTMVINGMKCVHCQARVETALQSLPAVHSVSVNLQDRTARLTLRQDIADEILIDTITREGYDVITVRS